MTPSKPGTPSLVTENWILLRGLGREAGHWGDFPQRLQNALPRARIHTVDLPGNGRWCKQTSPTHVADYLMHCRNQASQQWQPPYSLLALSMGAMVAAQWAYSAPTELRRLVLMGTSFRPISRFWERLRPSQYATLLSMALTPSASVHAIERAIWHMTSNGTPDEAAVIAQWVALHRLHPVRKTNLLRQLIAAARFRVPPYAPPVPTLILGGAADQLVSPHCSSDIARRWRCAVQLHPDAGHDLALDAPQWIVDQVCAWMAHGERQPELFPAPASRCGSARTEPHPSRAPFG